MRTAPPLSSTATPYFDLTPRGQVRRLRRLAEEALAAYGLRKAQVTFINHGENTTWRIDLPKRLPGPTPYGCHPSRVLLRLHRATYNYPREIASELMWLDALRRDTELAVPVPLATTDGQSLLEWNDPAVGGHRVATATRWVEGRMLEKRITAAHHERLGMLMAQLHDHASSWQRPRNFRRARWDDRGLATPSGNSDRGGCHAWALLPVSARRVYRQARDRVLLAMAELGEGPDAYGLIHSDLHMHNVLFYRGEARPLDFDDALYGHWIFDLAVTIQSTGRDSLAPVLRGYRRVRPFPEEQLRFLPIFMAARYASVMLWVAGRAEENPRFIDIKERYLDRSVNRCRELLREK